MCDSNHENSKSQVQLDSYKIIKNEKKNRKKRIKCIFGNWSSNQHDSYDKKPEISTEIFLTRFYCFEDCYDLNLTQGYYESMLRDLSTLKQKNIDNFI